MVTNIGDMVPGVDPAALPGAPGRWAARSVRGRCPACARGRRGSRGPAAPHRHRRRAGLAHAPLPVSLGAPGVDAARAHPGRWRPVRGGSLEVGHPARAAARHARCRHPEPGCRWRRHAPSDGTLDRPRRYGDVPRAIRGSVPTSPSGRDVVHDQHGSPEAREDRSSAASMALGLLVVLVAGCTFAAPSVPPPARRQPGDRARTEGPDRSPTRRRRQPPTRRRTGQRPRADPEADPAPTAHRGSRTWTLLGSGWAVHGAAPGRATRAAGSSRGRTDTIMFVTIDPTTRPGGHGQPAA